VSEFNDTSIRLVSGEPFDYLDPDAHTIELHDVAHALARCSRYAGHCVYTWTVAQHTILVAHLIGDYYREPRLALAGLHHDDVEAFTGDWTSPMKVACQRLGLDYVKALERPIETAICRQLGLVVDDLHAGVVKDADRLALVIEQCIFKPGYDPRDCDPDVDEDVIARYVPIIELLMEASTAGVEGSWLVVHDELSRDPVA
jgi:hypothetical protein